MIIATYHKGDFCMAELKAVIYARFSDNSPREESIEGQIRGCTAFAERNGYKLIGTYAGRSIRAWRITAPISYRKIFSHTFTK